MICLKKWKYRCFIFDREDIIGNTKDVICGFQEVSEGVHNIDEINEVIRPGLGAKIFRRNILKTEMFLNLIYLKIYIRHTNI